MRRSLESSSRSHNLDMSKDPEGINQQNQPKSFEEHLEDVKSLKERIAALPSLSSDEENEINQATEKIKREQEIDSARKKVLDAFKKSPVEAPRESRPLDLPEDLEGVDMSLNVSEESSPEPEPSSEFEPLTSEEPPFEPQSKPLSPENSFEPISAEPESFQMPEPFEAPDFLASEFEPLAPEDSPGYIPPEPEPTPETVPEPTPEQSQFKGESEETIKFEGKKALDALKQIHANLASATPDQVQRFNTLYQELSDISKATPISLEEEQQQLTNLFNTRDKINQLQSELVRE